jgi:hypothetical protein
MEKKKKKKKVKALSDSVLEVSKLLLIDHPDQG